ncbi:PREDICTED: uncharacterized protein LOC106323787 [Brassica oleracea var. oleracea]|uniref:uncharacterized protein LOC106323787 n=1 Tax=Brassica oleracea var. oleracea TaxID=109376 RepID=UPI0006A6F727|nr:PREDICTED: uncharacterized protein LOC106323787 [Brassica oleracea var. oleracea]
MDSNPYRHGSNFVDLLTSQQSVFSLVEETVPEDTPAERKERRMWTLVEDMVLISSWLNTIKDPVVGNEQRSGAFWNRIAAYFAASPKVAATEHRESTHCKQRWHKINDQVNKFCGAFEAATREKTRSGKRRKLDEGSQSETSHAVEEERPPGVKAAKGKNKNVKWEERLSQFQTMWEIKQKDLVSKDRLSRNRILDRLLAKQEPLDEVENDVVKKLLAELLN